MSERHLLPIKASIGEYRFRYLVVGCVALVLAFFALIVGVWLALFDTLDCLRRVGLGFVLGTAYVVVVCGYHISLFRRSSVVHTSPITPLSGVVLMLGLLLLLGWSLMLALGFLGSSLAGYFVLTLWERVAKRKVVVMKEELWRSELRVVGGDVRVVYVS